MTRETNGEIDAGAMSRLLDVFGRDKLAPLLDACLEDLETTLSMLEEAGARRPPSAVQHCAHRLAGVLAQYACPGGAEQAALVSSANASEAAALTAGLIARGRRCQWELRMYRNALEVL